MSSRPSASDDGLPIDVTDGGAAPGDRAVPPDNHPWAPAVLDSWDHMTALHGVAGQPPEPDEDDG